VELEQGLAPDPVLVLQAPVTADQVRLVLLALPQLQPLQPVDQVPEQVLVQAQEVQRVQVLQVLRVLPQPQQLLPLVKDPRVLQQALLQAAQESLQLKGRLLPELCRKLVRKRLFLPQLRLV
jgi:hypothetical protein